VALAKNINDCNTKSNSNGMKSILIGLWLSDYK